MGRQSALRHAKRALQALVNEGSITVDQAKLAFRCAKASKDARDAWQRSAGEPFEE